MRSPPRKSRKKGVDGLREVLLELILFLFPVRSMVGHLVLAQAIEVRILDGEPKKNAHLVLPGGRFF